MLDKTIGFALCGSFCTYAKAMAALKNLTNIYAKVVRFRNCEKEKRKTDFSTPC